jgi:hypothetical protein
VKDLELRAGETLLCVYLTVRPLPPTKNWAAKVLDTGKEFQAPSRALAIHLALKSVECT